jgi:hypothetical protein
VEYRAICQKQMSGENVVNATKEEGSEIKQLGAKMESVKYNHEKPCCEKHVTDECKWPRK